MRSDCFLRTLQPAKQTERETVSRWQPETQMTNQLPLLPTIPLKSPQQVGKRNTVKIKKNWLVLASDSFAICRMCL